MRAALSVSEYERLRIRNEVEGTDVPLDSCLRRNDGAASRNLEFCVACQLDLWVTISAEAGTQGGRVEILSSAASANQTYW